MGNPPGQEMEEQYPKEITLADGSLTLLTPFEGVQRVTLKGLNDIQGTCHSEVESGLLEREMDSIGPEASFATVLQILNRLARAYDVRDVQEI